MKFLKWTIGTIIALVSIYCVTATALIYWPHPDHFAKKPLTADEYKGVQTYTGVNYSQTNPYQERSFEMADGVMISAREYLPVVPVRASDVADTIKRTPEASVVVKTPVIETVVAAESNSESNIVVIFLHGVASSAAVLNHTAGKWAQMTGAKIITPDLRGHGASGGTRFDVPKIGQYERDLAEMVRAVKLGDPDARIVIAGHSMGGGIALRYALLEDAPKVDGYLLLAPNMGAGPTMPNTANIDPEVAGFVQQFVYFRTKRFVGTLMMNIIGIHVFDHKPVLFFNAPPEMPAYSYSAIASAQPNAPQDATVALAAIEAPLIVIVGENDEAFIASAYEEIVSANSAGRTVLLPGLNHNTIINDGATFEIVRNWLNSLP